MQHSHMTIALALFCGFHASAQTADSTSAASQAPNSSPAIPARDTIGAGREAARDEEKPIADSLRTVPFNLGIAPGSSANGSHPERVRNHVSIDLAAGEAGEIEGVQLAGGLNEVHGRMGGVQGSGGLNHVYGDAKGLQFSSVNLVDGGFTGWQTSSMYNRTKGDMGGLQSSSFGNSTLGEFHGLQASAFYNGAGTVKGMQLGSFDMADTLYGLQLGFLNVSGRAKGAQVGFVNIVTKGGNTAQIGLVNIHPDTRIYAESWVDETRSVHVAMNYGGPNFYNLVEIVGTTDKPQSWGLGLGFGARMASEKTILSLDQSALVLGSSHNGDEACKEDGDHDDCAANVQLRTRLTVGRHLLGRFAVFGGLSYNVLLVPPKTSGERLLEPMGAYHYDPTDRVRLWPGAFIGVRI